MSENPMVKAALLMVTIVVVVVAGCEWHLRSQHVVLAYDDGPPLWAHKRGMVYEPSEKTVVFIGSSRIKYDLNIPTWETLTGTKAVQLAVEGSNPRPILEDLANDHGFKGRLVVDVTEGLFFSNAPPNVSSPNKNIKYYHDLTPAQRVSFWLNKPLESTFVFLDKEGLSFNAKLDQLEIPSRPGVFMMPIFPMDFGRTTFDREQYMTERFLQDTSLQKRVIGIWNFFRSLPKGPPMSEEELTGIFQSVKAATDKIRSRGGEVIFVRTPSSDPMLTGENKAFPREKYWDRLLKETNCQGIHFADYEPIDHFVCPELSHLSPQDAELFTRHFVDILAKDKQWRFPAMQAQKQR